MKRLDYDRRQAFYRLARLNAETIRCAPAGWKFATLRSIYLSAQRDPLAGAFSGYAP